MGTRTPKKHEARARAPEEARPPEEREGARKVGDETLTADGEALTADGEEITLSLMGERLREPKVERRARSERLREVLGIVRRYDILHGLTPLQFKALLEELGPTFVKAGQILSMRTEIIPPAFASVLEELRTHVEPMAFSTVEEVLEGAYERPLGEVFEMIDPVPIGSASIAQVHKARLATGELVAVKVQRPHVRETMAQDIEVLRRLVRRFGGLLKSLQVMDFQGVLDELWESFTEETDFLAEARNLREFREANASVAYVTVPKPHFSLSTSEVLVMEYVEGISISKPEELSSAGYDLQDIGEKLVENYAKQVLDDGFFHADPHPGNIMVRDRKIVWIDLGMMGRLSAYYRGVLRDVMRAVASKDTPALARGLLALSQSREMGDVDRSALLADLDQIVETYGSIDLAELDIGRFLADLIALARRFNVELPGAMTMIARGLVTLEGVLDEFIPGVSMITIMEAHLEEEVDPLKEVAGELKDLTLEGKKALHGTLDGLSQLGLVASMLTRGQLKVNMDFSGSTDPVEDLSHVADRLTLGVIVAGLLLGSAMLIQSGVSSGILALPIVGLIGYGIALLMALYIAWDIWKRHRRRKRAET